MRRPALWTLLLASSLIACSGGDDDNNATNNDSPGMDQGADASEDAPDMDASGDDMTAEVDQAGEQDMTLEAVDPLTLSPSDDGLYEVGYRSFEHTYTPAEGAPARTIVINVWYPTRDTEGKRPRYLGLFASKAAWEDASLASSPWPDGDYPVHLHSHGNQGYPGAEAPLLYHFARHGWVVVAPDHTNNTFKDHKDPRPMPLYYHRPLDLRAALDAVEDLPADDPLAGKLATDEVFLSGHSFGGWTTWLGAGATFDADAIAEKCAQSEQEGGGGCSELDVQIFAQDMREPRAVAGMPTAGTLGPEWSGEDGLKSAAIPILAMTGDEDPSMDADKAQRQWERSEGADVTWIQIQGGCHETFSLGNCPNLDGARGDAIVQTYGMAFARRHVLGDDSEEIAAILDGSATVDEAAAFQKR